MTQRILMTWPTHRFPYGYSGELRDPDGGMPYGFRTYDPAAGRWSSADPAKQRGSARTPLNFYQMVDANPVTHRDDRGLMKLQEMSRLLSGLRRVGGVEPDSSSAAWPDLSSVNGLTLRGIGLITRYATWYTLRDPHAFDNRMLQLFKRRYASDLVVPNDLIAVMRNYLGPDFYPFDEDMARRQGYPNARRLEVEFLHMSLAIGDSDRENSYTLKDLALVMATWAEADFLAPGQGRRGIRATPNSREIQNFQSVVALYNFYKTQNPMGTNLITDSSQDFADRLNAQRELNLGSDYAGPALTKENVWKQLQASFKLLRSEMRWTLQRRLYDYGLSSFDRAIEQANLMIQEETLRFHQIASANDNRHGLRPMKLKVFSFYRSKLRESGLAPELLRTFRKKRTVKRLRKDQINILRTSKTSTERSIQLLDERRQQERRKDRSALPPSVLQSGLSRQTTPLVPFRSIGNIPRSGPSRLNEQRSAPVEVIVPPTYQFRTFSFNRSFPKQGIRYVMKHLTDTQKRELRGGRVGTKIL